MSNKMITFDTILVPDMETPGPCSSARSAVVGGLQRPFVVDIARGSAILRQ
jgi:hypothetical protein